MRSLGIERGITLDLRRATVSLSLFESHFIVPNDSIAIDNIFTERKSKKKKKSEKDL